MYAPSCEYDIFYKDFKVGNKSSICFVAGEVVVGTEGCARADPAPQGAGISYLKVVGKQDALLLNFGGLAP